MKKLIPLQHMIKVHLILLGLTFIDISANKSPIHIVFAHGLGGEFESQGNYYKERLFDRTTQRDYTFTGPNFPENSNPALVSLCQKPEVLMLNKMLAEACQNNNNKPVILSGVSRGASTVLTSRVYDPLLHEKVAARIIESPFSSFESLLKRHPLYGWLPVWLTKKLFIKIAAPNANINGIIPIDAVSQFSNDQTPTLIVCSKTDEIVSWEESKDLAIALKKAGNKNVYLLVLEKGKHAKLLGRDSIEAELYCEVVRQFLAKYIYQTNENFPLLKDIHFI